MEPVLKFSEEVPGLKELFKKYLAGLDKSQLTRFLIALSGSPVLPDQIMITTEKDSDAVVFSTCATNITIPENLLLEVNQSLFEASMERKTNSRLDKPKPLFNSL